MPEFSMRAMLEAGIHFGHQTRRWNPKMKPYIYGERNGIYIIDLQKSVQLLRRACDFVTQTVARGGKLIFVGTKRQAQAIVAREAERVGMFYVTKRWLGGTLTNFQTIKGSLDRLDKLEHLLGSESFEGLSKKERTMLTKKNQKLSALLVGIRKMKSPPQALFVVDPKREHIAVKEANTLGIPIVAIADTNADPDELTYLIPGNDDAIRGIQLISRAIADAVIEGGAVATGGRIVNEAPVADT
ncbi:MAG: 30S ribosomal protein S2 [Candidatus Coatesbacteria bacterium RBG_13_66_14]|uniref:Small ribosomal subunit protein uS2 n=1 Tax=Candidatus Coatesbacteria bacterium RBG_13_66_14 TaxID=1817816 RepID=A0A1F5FG37_9BACT|nr:MAG: 30S ribosomal protein S2 [Candidatus Coatesbacteria bacterium RBG_13_66_14]